MTEPKVTIIVLNYNGLYDTKECLKSLLKTSYSHYCIIVVDNGSLKNEAIILRHMFPDKRISFKRFGKNKGFSGGNNYIMKRVRTPYVALVNNDVTVVSSWLRLLVNRMEQEKDVMVIQPKILWAYNRKYFDYAGAAGGFIDYLGYPFTRGRIFNTLEPDRGQYNRSTDIFWASGATTLIRRSVLKKVGYFDELFFNYMEEIDLCFRIHQTDLRVLYEPKSVVYHKVASTARHNSGKKRFLEHRNNLLLIIKNFPMSQLLIIFPVRIILEIISIFYYVLIFRIDFAESVIKALFSTFILLPKYVSQRKSSATTNVVLAKNLIYPQSIVFTYFILGKKTFKQLKHLAGWKI